MNKLTFIVKRILQFIVIALFLVIIVLTALQIATRYFRLAVVPWTEEVTRLVLVWASYFAITLVMAEKDHINIDFLYKRLPAKLQVYNLLFVDILFLFFCAVAIIFGWRVAAVGWTDHNTALKYPRSLFFMPVPIAGFFSLFFLIPDFIHSVQKLSRRGRKEEEK